MATRSVILAETLVERQHRVVDRSESGCAHTLAVQVLRRLDLGPRHQRRVALGDRADDHVVRALGRCLQERPESCHHRIQLAFVVVEQGGRAVRIGLAHRGDALFLEVPLLDGDPVRAIVELRPDLVAHSQRRHLLGAGDNGQREHHQDHQQGDRPPCHRRHARVLSVPGSIHCDVSPPGRRCAASTSTWAAPRSELRRRRGRAPEPARRSVWPPPRSRAAATASLVSLPP